MMSKEFEIGTGLVKRFREVLEKIINAGSEEEAKELIETVKHPMFGAMAQIKSGEGPLKDAILEPFAVVVAQMRNLTDLKALQTSLQELINLIDQAEDLAQEPAQAQEGS